MQNTIKLLHVFNKYCKFIKKNDLKTIFGQLKCHTKHIL